MMKIESLSKARCHSRNERSPPQPECLSGRDLAIPARHENSCDYAGTGARELKSFILADPNMSKHEKLLVMRPCKRLAPLRYATIYLPGRHPGRWASLHNTRRDDVIGQPPG